MIALLASAVGNEIVKSPEVEVLSPPNANVQTALSDCVSLYISAPFAVIVLELNVRSEKSHKAVVPLATGVTLVNAAPAAVYPVPDTSLDVEYAVVLAPKEAELVYKASLNVLPEVAVKLCVPTSISCLKDVHIAVDIAIIDS